jgi:hypothetical protein
VDDAGLEPVGQGQAPVGVAGEDPGGQPVGGVVALATASSAPSTTSTVATGPKVSTRASSLSAGTSASRVAWKQRPTRSPPASTLAPPATGPATVSRARWLIRGPMTVPASAGSPTLRPAVLAARRSK